MKAICLFLCLSVGSAFTQERRRLTGEEMALSERAAWAIQFHKKDPESLRAIRESAEVSRKIDVEYAQALALAAKAEMGVNVVVAENDPKKLQGQIKAMQDALLANRQRIAAANAAAAKQEQDKENTRQFFQQQEAKRRNELQNEIDRLEYENRKLKRGQ